MSILNFGSCQWIGVTTFSPGLTFVIPPVAGQIGIHFYSGSTGIEIAGAGASYAPLAYTLISGVTVTLQRGYQNGSSLILAANGKGIPVWETTLNGKAFVGAPYIWGTASGASLLLTVSFIGNDGYING